MAISKEQYLETAKGRVTQQFKDKENIQKLLATWLEDSEVLQDTISDVDDIKYIDRAEGEQLDNIGEIVGQPRILIDADLIAFFGFQGELASRSYGSLTDASKGGRWKSLDEATTGNITLNDPEYRLFIRAKILRNKTVATTEDVIESIKFLFQADKVHLIEGENPASYRVAIGNVLSIQQKNLISYSYQDGVERNLLVKPAGVGFENLSEFNPDQFFAFQGVDGAQGYGDIKEIADYVPYYETFGMVGYGDLETIADTFEQTTVQNFSYISEGLLEIPKEYEGPTKYFGFEGAANAGAYSDLRYPTDYNYSGAYRSIEQDPNEFSLTTTSIELPILQEPESLEVYVNDTFIEPDRYVVNANLLTFDRGYSVGSVVRIEQDQKIVFNYSTYTLKNSAINTIAPFGSSQTLGDVNDPSVGSRWKSLGEPDDANNILYDGPVKQIEYKDPDITTLSEGGYYSSIVN